MESELFDQYVHQLRLEKYDTELQKGDEALTVLEHIVANEKWDNASELLGILKNIQSVIQTKMPWETTPCNMVQRVIKVVKDEYNTCIREQDRGGQAYQKMVYEVLSDPMLDDQPDMSTEFPTLKDNIIKVILELKAELEQCLDLIAMQGETKVHIDDVIMTSGYCPTVLAFLKKASKKLRLNVIVAQSAPNYDGNKMAKLLSDAKISTTLISDAAIYALMSRVSKVIIGTQTVLKNGGIKTFVGANLLATVAKFHSVPLYVCCPTYMFSYLTCEQTNLHKSPDSVTTDAVPKSVNVSMAKLDYVPPELIASFITNNEGFAPSSVYRLLTELYDPVSYDL